ncbi:MAG: bifunctional hydroxymethylpyrimidine kinase/phosphomethylpyrimidine kinase [Hyphomicrobiaceae bacterium]|nr:bifunctional hydroxymethylpyrimidine kinase/phosphomethylpyrimidine kinase [Hyphomicrobiaceae bacterium]
MTAAHIGVQTGARTVAADNARVPAVLTIAGSDSSGGAGIQADLKTFTALGVYGASVVTALTAQNTVGVQGVHVVPVAFVVQQIESCISDLNVCAIKTGMLATAEIVRAVAQRLALTPDIPVVVDPVMVATSGDALLSPDAVVAYQADLFPKAVLITPNLHEAARLLDGAVARSLDEAAAQAKALLRFGSGAVLIKGGHFDASDREAIDVLVTADGVTMIKGPRIATVNTHGTGCTLSAAIAAQLAKGLALEDAVVAGKAFLGAALAAGTGLRFGAGHGPVDHLYAIKRTRD